MIAAPAKVLVIHINGEPVEQGSMVPSVNPHTGRTRLKHHNVEALERWRKTVAFAARRAIGQRPHFDDHDPLVLGVVFRLPRPGYGRPGSRMDHPTAKHDQDKLTRAVRDALSGELYPDDGQVIGATVELPDGRVTGFADYKRYAADDELPGCTIRVARLSDLLSEAR